MPLNKTPREKASPSPAKAFLDQLEDVVAPAHSALIVIDLQNDYCKPEGTYARQGHDVSMVPNVLSTVAELIEGAHRSDVSVIYIQMTRLPGLKSISPSYLRFLSRRNRLAIDQMGCVAGTWGAEIVQEVAPQAGDIVIPKWRSSAFVGTPLELILRSNGIDSVVLCGFATHACVESTARDAFNLDFYVTLVEDAVGSASRSLHDASLEVMRSRVDVVSSADVLRIWS